MNIFKKEMPDVVKDNRLEYDYCGGLPEFKYFDRNIKKQVNGYSVISVYMTDAKLYDISCYSSERPKVKLTKPELFQESRK